MTKLTHYDIYRAAEELARAERALDMLDKAKRGSLTLEAFNEALANGMQLCGCERGKVIDLLVKGVQMEVSRLRAGMAGILDQAGRELPARDIQTKGESK